MCIAASTEQPFLSYNGIRKYAERKDIVKWDCRRQHQREETGRPPPEQLQQFASTGSGIWFVFMSVSRNTQRRPTRSLRRHFDFSFPICQVFPIVLSPSVVYSCVARPTWRGSDSPSEMSLSVCLFELRLSAAEKNAMR